MDDSGNSSGGPSRTAKKTRRVSPYDRRSRFTSSTSSAGTSSSNPQAMDDSGNSSGGPSRTAKKTRRVSPYDRRSRSTSSSSSAGSSSSNPESMDDSGNSSAGPSKNWRVSPYSSRRSRSKSSNSPGEDRMWLNCRRPHSISEGTLFSVDRMRRSPDLEPFALTNHDGSRTYYHIQSFNEDRHVLLYPEFDYYLCDWLAEQESTLDEDYRSWDRVNRPKDSTRLIIIGILRSVDLYLKDHSYHGYLHRLENYVLKFHWFEGNTEEVGRCDVILLHRDQTPNYDTDLTNPRARDLEAVRWVTFDQLLHTSHNDYPPDLKDLSLLLFVGRNGEYLDDVTLNLANSAYHYSLWYWRKKYFFLHHLMIDNKKARLDTVKWKSTDIEEQLYDRDVLEETEAAEWMDWTDYVNSPTMQFRYRPLFECFVDHPQRECNLGFFKFIKNVYEHILDDWTAYIQGEPTWEDMKRVQHYIDQAFPAAMYSLAWDLQEVGLLPS